MNEESTKISKSTFQTPVVIGGEMDPEEPPEPWR